MAIALVKAGTPSTSVTSAITPAFGQATTAGDLLIAVVAANANAAITTTGTGWSKANGVNNANGSSAVFYKKNCGASEVAPAFACVGATFMAAQLDEYSGAATTGGQDSTNTATGTTTGITATNSAADTGSKDLVVVSGFWLLSSSKTRTWTDSFNNGGSAVVSNDNGSTSTTTHFRFVGAINTGNSSADSDTQTISASQFLTGGLLTIASFAPASVANSKTLTGTLTAPSGVIANAIAKTVAAAGQSFAGAALGNAISKGIVAGWSSTGSALRNAISKQQAAGLSQTGSSLRNAISKGVTAGLSASGQLLRAITKAAFTAGQSLAGSLQVARLYRLSLSAVQAVAGSSPSRLIGTGLGGGWSGAGVVTRAISKGIAGGWSGSGQLARAIAKGMAASASVAGVSLTRVTTKGMAAGQALAGSLATVIRHFYTVSLTAAAALAGILQRQSQKAFLATQGVAGSTPVRAISKGIVAGQSLVGSTSRAISKGIGAGLVATGAVTKLMATGFSAGVGFVGSVAGMVVHIALAPAGLAKTALLASMNAVAGSARNVISFVSQNISGSSGRNQV